jgi:uncharacterized membrane protein YbhN (UPF0104 family)
MKNNKGLIIFIVKLLVSAALLGYLLTRLDSERFVQTLASANFLYIALALLVYLVTQAVSAMRWTVLSRPLGIRTPYRELAVYYFIGMFFNLFAPSTVGGDVTRVYYLARDQNKERRSRGAGTTVFAAVSVLMDRAIGMVVLIWLGAIGILLFPQYGVPPAIRALVLSLAAGFLLGGLLMPLVRRVLPDDAHPWVLKLRVILTSYSKRWRAIPQAITLSFIVHLVQAWMHVLMGLALHLSLPLSFCIIVYPLVGTFSALPISVNGFGLREGGYIFLLALIGINSEKGVAFGLLLFMIVALDSLIGGILFLLKKNSEAAGTVSEAEI